MTTRPKLTLLLALVLALTLCLTGCGGTGTAQSTPATSSAQQSAQSEAGSSATASGEAQAPADSSGQGSSADPAEQAAPTGILSQFSAQDLEGNDFDQSMFQGHTLTMVNVWATFCTPCINEMPDLGVLAQDNQDQGVQIVGLVSDVLAMDGSLDQDQMELAREIVDSTAANYTHLVPSEDLYNLLGQITSVPTTFFVDENGAQVGGTYIGAKDKDQWQQIIDQLLTEVEA